MPTATVRLNGSLSSYSDDKNPLYVSFSRKKVTVQEILLKMALGIPEKSVAFLAVNGMKSTKDQWITDGDVIDIFPFVAGG
jgi:molybdopterin converting factor small subunit